MDIDAVDNFINRRLHKQVSAIIRFGSSNLNDFDKYSDIDYYVLMKRTTPTKLKRVALVRESAKKKFKIQIDIHIYGLYEFENSLNGNCNSIFLNGWSIMAIKNGDHKIVYMGENFKRLQRKISNYNNVKCGALSRADFYINRLREILHSNFILLRGEFRKPTKMDILKIFTSGAKCILMFLLANKGIYVSSKKDILKRAKNFWNIKRIIKVFNDRKDGKFDLKDINYAFRELEKIYLGELNVQKTTK